MKNTQPTPTAAAAAVDSAKSVAGKTVELFGETYYKIENYHAMPPFFMSIVSSGNHWLYISSNGGITAGRINADQALFPYYTEDKITDNYENTGSKTILRVQRDGQARLWEPFTERQCGQYVIERNLYKNLPGTALVFEEINHSLELRYRYSWRTSEKFGFIKTSYLQNTSSTQPAIQVRVLDGLQNILPANVSAATQSAFSCLLDAYKRSEIAADTGLGIYTLNSTLTDLAEPSESLLAATVFQVGLQEVSHLLSSSQLERFRAGKSLTPETEVRGRRGAYFVNAHISLPPGGESVWYFVADTHQDGADTVAVLHTLSKEPVALCQEIEQDIQANTEQLRSIVASADGWQACSNELRSMHHYANVMFNVMRGGVFADQYEIDTADFKDFVSTHFKRAPETYAHFLAALPEKIHVADLHARLSEQHSTNLTRLGYTYLPLTFSRRHGDPSRPWNKFAINLKKADGSLRLDHEGNWRDIFQNWEALAYSYPEFVEGMIFTFLSATTADGYNPYRITRSGLDWEIPEPGNPWANIGYWSDHQIIYLLKLMEISANVHPGRLNSFLEQPILSFANVPYRIKRYSDLLKDPYNTIDFDFEMEDAIDKRVEAFGTDGKLLYTSNGQVLHRTMTEKLLTLLLTKLTNFVPEGGIWMNTQRPEWNDANNALVGKGLSVVTLGYLRRYVSFCRELFAAEARGSFQMSREVTDLFIQIKAVLEQFQANLEFTFNDNSRREMMDSLGMAGSDYRWNFYNRGLSGELAALAKGDLLAFLELTRQYIEHSLRANKRSDNLYHTYNILHLGEKSAAITHLQEMLEGQVAILSSGLLSADESLALLHSLQNSALFRDDQETYILYPDKSLLSFLNKNTLPPDQVRGLRLPEALAEAQDKTLLVRDIAGMYHFSGLLHNAKDLHHALEELAQDPLYAGMVAAEKDRIAALFENLFRHTEFTGRSGTFFGYEGLGSVYWHMVSKLLLAVQENVLWHKHEPASPGLIEKYRQISAGLGFNKSPDVFGAFPTDPYSHTPKGQGARQPGMTGLVKEEIIARYAEVGLVIENGCLNFNPLLIDRKELLTTPGTYEYQDVTGKTQQLELAAGCLAYTVCGVPIVVSLDGMPGIEIYQSDGSRQEITGNRLDEGTSQHIFRRDGAVHHMIVHL